MGEMGSQHPSSQGDTMATEWKLRVGNAGHLLRFGMYFSKLGLGQLVEKNAEFTSKHSLDFSKFCNRRCVTLVFKAVSKNLTRSSYAIFCFTGNGTKNNWALNQENGEKGAANQGKWWKIRS